MSSVRASDIPEEQKMWTDIWNWRKNYYNPENSDDYWKQFTEDGIFLGEKYGKLCQDIVIAVLNEVKGRWKKC